MRKTKIICTIGPACADKETLRRMCLAGMNVARLNFSHGTHDDHLAHIRRIRKVREELHLPIAIMLDTKGPEYRIGCFENGSIELKDGDLFTLTTQDVVGDETSCFRKLQGTVQRAEARRPCAHQQRSAGAGGAGGRRAGCEVLRTDRWNAEQPQEHELSWACCSPTPT